MIQLKDVVIGDKLAVLNPGLEPWVLDTSYCGTRRNRMCCSSYM